MPPLPPLFFKPIYKRYLWGGRRLGTVLGKEIGEGNDYAESWEVADHPQGQSVVAWGPLAGISLHELVETRSRELLGRHAGQPRFPLIFKYLDCQRDLSVQVHPNDAAAALLNPPDLGKTEAWVIVDAAPGSKVFAGLKADCDRVALEAAMRDGRTAECLHSFEPRAGDCLFIPAGTVHALGAGLLVAEIQQASDTTYRLYDWDRVGTDGRPRTLHVTEALEATDHSAGPVQPQTPQTIGQPHVERLVASDKFVLDRWTLNEVGTWPFGGDDRFHILTVLSGQVRLFGIKTMLSHGNTVLLPACVVESIAQHSGKAILLDMYLP